MKPTRVLMNNDPNELRKLLRTQLKRVRHHQYGLAGKGFKLDRLELTVSGIQEAALACQTLLSNLGIYLDIVDRMKDQELRDTILTRARQDLKRLMQLLSRIVAWTDRERRPPCLP